MESLRFPRVVPALVLLVSSCRSLEITPDALRAGSESRPERLAALASWEQAVELANEFLASEFRRALPAGRYELDGGGMRFVGDGIELPIRVVSSSWGDLVVRTGFAAQEREFGFVVGTRSPARDLLVDNSFFRYSGGEPMDPPEIASLVLHETAHVVHREGTVGTWNAISYYLEAIFLLRASKHSAERHAHATSEEFRFFWLERGAPDESKAIYRETFEEHLAGPASHCVHASP